MHTFEQRNAMLHYHRAFAEMPIGDPMSGAAYGEYLKSKGVSAIIGVVAAVAAVYTGGATLGFWGAAAGGSVSVGTALAGGAMMAGGVMSGVGAITGNKKLTKIGGVLSLAGGLGSMYFGGPTAVASTASEGGSNIAGETTKLAGETSSVATSSGSAGIEAGAYEPAKESLTLKLSDAMGSSDATTGLAKGTSVTDPGFSNNVAANTGYVTGDPAAQAFAPAVDPNKGILSQAWDTVKDAGTYVKDTVKDVGTYANDNKALVEIAGKAFSNSPQGSAGGQNLQDAQAALYNAQATTQSTVQAANQAQIDALKEKTAAEAQQRKNAGAQVMMLNPNDPQYAAKKADAIARGIQWMDFNVPGQNGPVTAGGVNWAQTTQTPNINTPRTQRPTTNVQR